MDRSRPPAHFDLAAFVDGLQARGRYTFVRSELIAAGGRAGPALEAALRRLRGKRRIATPRRGFHVVVPLEYREAGCPPASWFVDDLLRALRQPYYVGLLSAAALHGAAHQQPISFQVVTDRPARPAVAGRVRIVFFQARRIAAVPVEERVTETGTMRVSTPEATAFDLVHLPHGAGGWSQIATVLGELADRIAGEKLALLAPTYPVPVVQRLGFLLEALGRESLAARLAESLPGRRVRPVLLAPRERSLRTEKMSEPWKVVPNVALEPDI
ncbi:MAG: type IV toxin-antitoxin system AbiEi family antitoxin [Thermoanaerobaculia bacterium]|nr:type IV toxin-antitoxin system AbiEi family antitoxin [Thermoanaerobaculia bacterium]